MLRLASAGRRAEQAALHGFNIMLIFSCVSTAHGLRQLRFPNPELATHDRVTIPPPPSCTLVPLSFRPQLRLHPAAGMVAVMNGDHMGPFNIGNPNEFTMLELAKVVQEVVDPKAELVYRENTADDPTRRRPDISKVRIGSGLP